MENVSLKAKANAHVGVEIAAVAALTPDRAVITFGSENRFCQLNQLANQIAHRLLRRHYRGDAVARRATVLNLLRGLPVIE